MNPTFDDLRCHYGTGRAYLISGTGRNKKYGYRQGVMCNLGDIERHEWQRMIRELIHQSGEDTLHKQLREWMSKHRYVEDTKENFYHHILVLHSMRIFEDKEWIYYEEFSKFINT